MLPRNRIPTHPGEVLSEEFLGPLGLTQVELARHIGVPVQRVNEIIRGKRGVTPETAWLLAQAFETTPEFWANQIRSVATSAAILFIEGHFSKKEPWLCHSQHKPASPCRFGLFQSAFSNLIKHF